MEFVVFIAALLIVARWYFKGESERQRNIAMLGALLVQAYAMAQADGSDEVKEKLAAAARACEEAMR